MSQKEKIVSIFQDVLALLRRKWAKVVVDDETLSNKDCELVHECFALNAILWFDVIGPRWSRRDILSWVALMCTAKLNDVLSVWEACDNYLITGTFDTTDELLARLRTEFPGLGGLVTPLRLRMDDFYASQRLGHAESLRDIRSCLLFTSRLTLTSFSKAKENSYAKYEECMTRISNVHTLPSRYMRSWVSSLYPVSEAEFLQGFAPRHGSGSVAEQRSDNRPLCELQKWKITNTSAVQYLLKKSGIRPLPIATTSPTNRCSRLSDVPKGIQKRRIICMEPTALMFLQQGVASALDFRKTKLRRHVDLRDASKNTLLAQQGSITGKYATIDLSSASDSVRWEFVSALFSEKPYLQRLMALCRSTHRVYPKELGGRIERNVHFAPMGSALCFPVEVLCFSAVVEEAIHLVDNGKSNYRVYGDDIIVEERYYDKVVELLTYYGFEVNLEKTFHGDSPFRESCGGHYFLGDDVTPFRVSRKFAGLTIKSATGVVGLVSMANRAINRYSNLRSVIVHYLMANNKVNYNYPCTTDPANTTYLIVNDVFPTVSAMEDRKRGKGNWYQYPERKCLALKRVLDTSITQATDELKLWKWLSHENHEASAAQEAIESFEDRNCKLVWTWCVCT